MTEDQRALAARLVACKQWRWVEGMLTNRGLRLTDVELVLTSALPSLDDFATAAILFRMALEARLAVNGGMETVGITVDTDVGTVAALALLAAWSA